MITLLSKKITKTLGLVALTGLSGLMSAQSLNWDLAGPVYNAGRIRNIVVDKADQTGNTIYAGSTSSGVFKTTDGGANWGPLDDQSLVKNISYMAQATDNTIYVATGEGFLRPGQILKAQLGTGLYKLSGSTLVSTNANGPGTDTLMFGHIITRIACSPVNAQVIALATNKGIYISDDGGGNFHAAANIPTTANANYGMAVTFDSNGILYCSVGNERSINPASGPATPAFNSVSGKVYRSSDNTLTNFNDITPTSSSLQDANYGRIEIAVAPSNNNVVYVSCARKSDGSTNGATMAGLFATYDAGQATPDWILVHQASAAIDPLSDGATLASGDYAHVLKVNPNDPNEVFFGGYGFYLFFGSTNNVTAPIWVRLGSDLLPNTQYYLHENIHDIELVGSNPTKFYFVTDAGIYRSTDLTASTSQTLPPSFQPFYKGLITGQFNSVSIETFPINTNTNTANGQMVTPESGFIGGTGGNGLNYFSGTRDAVAEEINYLNGEVYNSEFSKVLSEAAILSVANGGIYRTTDARSSAPNLASLNSYTGTLSKIVSSSTPFEVGNTSTGSPFRLWENYGQADGANDPVVFYNDTVRVQYSIVGVSTLTAQTNFTFSVSRPNRDAKLDSIVIRTATTALIGSGISVSTPFNNPQQAFIKLSNNYSVPTTTTTITIPPITGSLGPISAAGVTLDPRSDPAADIVSVTFSTAPFAAYTTTSYPNVSDPAAFYHVFATAYYRYDSSAVVTVTDNNISTRTFIYSDTLRKSLRWAYGSSLPTYTVGASASATAVSNPTYVLTSGGAAGTTSISQSTPVFSVNPSTTTGYTITTYGDYTVSAKTVTYALAADTDTTLPGSTYTYVLLPDNITQTVSVPTGTTPVVFNVTPTVGATYTITQSGSSTLTNVTYSTVGTPTYVLAPGSMTQTGNPVFTITIPPGATATSYTLNGLADPAQFSTSVTTSALPVKTSTTLGSSSVPTSPNNPYVKIPTDASGKLAVSLSYAGITKGIGERVVVVSRNPLSFNDPLNFVRLSQTGCLSTNPDGSASSTSTIAINGEPTVLQWSNKGTELYYATSTNKLYRVSYINLIMDFSSSSYSGKVHTDLFNYSSNGPGTVVNGLNPNCPYRTTLIGSFTKRITSISISKDDKSMVLTFDEDPLSSSPNLIQYTDSLQAKLTAHITFVAKTTPQLKTLDNRNLKMYCSLIENHDPKKVFLGTDNGIFYTSDITAASPSWANANNNQLPIVQVFDIKQQTMGAGACYNSGEIYVATYGRGVWTNSDYRDAYDIAYMAIKEQQLKEKNISVFPNPTNGDVTVSFNGTEGETTLVHLFDISGRLIKTESLGKLSGGETNYTLQTSSLNPGIYLVNVVSGNNKYTSKLIVTK